MSFVKASVIHDPCESVRYDDQISELLNKKGKAGIGYDRPESPKSGWLKNRLDKEKAKAGSKSFVQNQQRRDFKKVKSEWRKVRPRRDLNGQNTKPKLNRSHNNSAQTLMDYHTGKTVKVIQVWVPKGEGNDLWQRLPKQTVPLTIELSPQRQFDDTLALVSEFFKVLHKQWADVCIAVVQFSTVGSLQQVGSHNFCRDIVAVITVIDIVVDASDFVGVFRRGTDVHMILSESSSSSSGSAHPDSPPTSADSSLHFNAYDIPPEEDSALEQLILPSTTTDISASLATLRESISRLIDNQTRDSRKSSDAHEEVMSKINQVESVILDSLAVQNQAFRGLIKSILQEAHNDNDVLSIALKAVRAQNAILTTDLADVRQEVKDLKAEFSKDFDDKLAVIRKDLLEFRVETQGQLTSLGTNLAELIAFITKGSYDKKGEVSSSHGRGKQ
ncbi:hypothetical protein F511_38382 [Dorcoceras hygrometricum]|uniref:Uncharacterized protein n=1 Tax=Dorcoceras hygrometricum TaxID=472368 RepID=A0A2Z7CLI4_9LAMI|nr:hypothetical protein F511_38382 [Dorcoceras hygrometricum]